MRNYTLQDLSMAGVCWELSESPVRHDTKKPLYSRHIILLKEPKKYQNELEKIANL